MNEIELKRQEIAALQKIQLEFDQRKILARTEADGEIWHDGYLYGYYAGQIELLQNQVVELERIHAPGVPY